MACPEKALKTMLLTKVKEKVRVEPGARQKEDTAASKGCSEAALLAAGLTEEKSSELVG